MLRKMWRKYRTWIVLVLVALVAWALAPQAVDLHHIVERFRSARPAPLVAIVLLQAARYLGSGLLMSLFGRSVGARVAPGTASLVALASGAASKLIPVAGAGGVAVRYAYLKRSGIADAAIGGYFVLQNVLGSGVMLSLFAASVAVAGHAGVAEFGAVVPTVGVLLVFAGAIVWIRRRPADCRRAGRGVGHVLDGLSARFGRHWPLEQRLDESGDSLGRALSLGGSPASTIGEALFYSSWTIVGDVASLYFAGVALGFRPGVAETVVAYGVASFAASAVAMPAGLGVTEGAIAAVLAAYGMDVEAAVSQVLLYRGLSFWLPILLGLLAAWLLRRRGTL